jgi:hypothetical protein
MLGRKVRIVAEAEASGATICSNHGDRRMKLSNRKPLFLALALTFAAPLAFAQSTTPTQDAQNAASTAQDAASTAQDAAKDATQAAQDATTQTTNEATNDAMAAQSGEPQKKNWSDLDTNKNGTLSASEAASVQSLASAFSTADSNADGELTQDEYKAYLETSKKSDSGG